MDNNIKKLMIAGIAFAAVCATAVAAPHKGRNAPEPRPASAHQAQQPKAARAHRAQPAPQPGHAGHARHERTRPAPQRHGAPQHRAGHKAPPRMQHEGRRHASHTPPPRPKNHRPCGRIHPYRHHIGERHVVILPPVFLVDDYYWTEEVLIDGVYCILYCYPDGTKRFADGTIFCYI